jgi:hypothetical protein
MAPSRHVHTTAKNFPSRGPIVKKAFFVAAPGWDCEQGTAIKQGEGHAEKIYSTLG